MNSPASGAATQVYSRKFDERFFALPADVKRHVQHRIDEMGRRLVRFPHYRMEGTDTFRLQVGDYRVIYQFDATRNEIFLIALGHRRDIYKQR